MGNRRRIPVSLNIPVKNWLYQRIVEPLLALLRQGISPDRLALCVAIGVVVGNIPILGISTILCAVIALTFRLNLPAIQIVQALMAPTQLLLIIPFVRLGEWILRVPPQPVSIEKGLELAGRGAGYAIVALWDAIRMRDSPWILVAPIAVLSVLQIVDAGLRTRCCADRVGRDFRLRLHTRVRSGRARFAEWHDEYGSAA